MSFICNRINSLTKRLRKEPEMMKQYNDISTDQINKRIVEKVTDSMQEMIGETYCATHRLQINRSMASSKEIF